MNCPHNLHPGWCMKCAYPDAEVERQYRTVEPLLPEQREYDKLKAITQMDKYRSKR